MIRKQLQKIMYNRLHANTSITFTQVSYMRVLLTSTVEDSVTNYDFFTIKRKYPGFEEAAKSFSGH